MRTLSPAAPGAVRPLDLVGLKLAIARLIRPLPPGLREHKESVGMRAVEFANRGFEARAHASGEIDHDPDVLPIHRSKRVVGFNPQADSLAEGNTVFVAGDKRQVGVDVSHWKARAGYRGLHRVKQACSSAGSL